MGEVTVHTEANGLVEEEEARQICVRYWTTLAAVSLWQEEGEVAVTTVAEGAGAD